MRHERKDSTITIPVAEYKHLLHCTVGVDAYARAARDGALTGEASAAAEQAVNEALLDALARKAT